VPRRQRRKLFCCVARQPANAVKPMVVHYFSIWVGHRIFPENWPILRPLASLLGVLGWLWRLSEALGHAGPAPQGPNEAQRNLCWRSWSEMLALLGRPISRFGASLGRCRLHARIWERFKGLFVAKLPGTFHPNKKNIHMLVIGRY